MIQRAFNRFRQSKAVRSLLLLCVSGFIALNVVAALQARAMTHFVPNGQSLVAQMDVPLPQKLWALLSGVQVPRPTNQATPANHHLPFEVRTIPLPNAEQIEAWYVPQEKPRAIIIMFIGYAVAKEGLLTPASHFHQLGYSTLMVDFRGAGGSSGNDTTLGVREAEDVEAAFHYAAQQWPNQPLLGYGISMGATAMMRAVALHVIQPAALILEGPFDRLSTTTRHRFDAVGVPSFPAADLLLFWGSVELGMNAFAHNPVEYAPTITCPTLLLHGERDPWISAEEIQSIANGIRGPTQLVTVPGVGHDMPFVYPAPGFWLPTVRGFLDGVGK